MASKEKVATFNGDEIWSRDDEDFDQLFFEEAPSEKQVPVFSPRMISDGPLTYSTRETITLVPGGSTTFYSSGAPGTRITKTLQRVPNTGGHSHGGGPGGTASPSSFVIQGAYPQNIPSTVTAPDASGVINLTVSFSQGSPSQVRHTLVVRTDGLVRLGSRPSIVLTGSTPTHPDNHYGTPAFVAQIAQLADAFHAEFNKPIYVNDMSLEWGGLFDWRATWAPPHSTHRTGRNADINSRSMNDVEKEFFSQAARGLGMSAVEHGNPLHWHVTG